MSCNIFPVVRGVFWYFVAFAERKFMSPFNARLQNFRSLARVVLAVAAITAGVGPSLSMAADWTPDASISNPALHQRLYQIGRHYAEVNFDPAADMVGSQSHHPPNRKEHSTRESGYYAYGLLLTGDEADRQLAQKVLLRVVAAQDVRPDSPNRGAFAWVAEQPPQDQNSASFDGLTLADVLDLDRRRPCLDPDVRAKVQAAAKLALAEVMARNVDPGYTNISMLSIAFAAAGEKLWSAPGAAAFAQTKLEAVMRLADDGEFAEYLSPTYYAVSFDGAYQARKFAFSDAFAAEADACIDHLWKQTAAAYHAPTYQLGGPFLRAYGDNMLTYAAGLKYFLYLALDGAYPLPDTETDHDWDKAGLMCIAELPIQPRPEFKQAPPPWREWTAVGSAGTPLRRLRQYRVGDFILGTVASQDEWKQKRNLVAYWRNEAPAPDGFRVGFCIDESNESLPGGFPGERIHFYSTQAKSTAIVAHVATSDIPGFGGFCTLVFDPAAKMDGDGSGPARILDGSTTTYVYPISQSPVTFTTQTDARTFRLMRAWSTSDAVGTARTLAYVIVFRPADQPAPVVSGLSLSSQKDGDVAEATVDGEKISVLLKD
jgi:hypothetical protein